MKKRILRCEICVGCSRTEDCGKCRFCKDKKKFGGTNRTRQKCQLRQCMKFGAYRTKDISIQDDISTKPNTELPNTDTRHYTDRHLENHLCQTEYSMNEKCSIERKTIKKEGPMDKTIILQNEIDTCIAGLTDDVQRRPPDKEGRRKKRRSLRFVADIVQQPKDVLGSTWLDESPESELPTQKNQRRRSKKIIIPPCSRITNIEEGSIELLRSPEKEMTEMQMTSVTPELVLDNSHNENSVCRKDTPSPSFELPLEQQVFTVNTPRCSRMDIDSDKSIPYTPSQVVDDMNLSSTPEDPLSDSVYMTPMSEVKQQVTTNVTEKNVNTSTSKNICRQHNRSSRKLTSEKKSRQQIEEISKQQRSGFMSICKSLAGKFMSFKSSLSSIQKEDELLKENDTVLESCIISNTENSGDAMKANGDNTNTADIHREVEDCYKKLTDEKTFKKDLIGEEVTGMNSVNKNLAGSLLQHTPQRSQESSENEEISPKSDSQQKMEAHTLGGPPENTIIVKVEVHQHVSELDDIASQSNGKTSGDTGQELKVSIAKQYVKCEPSQLDKELDKIVRIDEFGKEIAEDVKKKRGQRKGSLGKKAVTRRFSTAKKVRKGSSSNRNNEKSPTLSSSGDADDIAVRNEGPCTMHYCKGNHIKTNSDSTYESEGMQEMEWSGVVSDIEVKREPEVYGIEKVENESICFVSTSCMNGHDGKECKKAEISSEKSDDSSNMTCSDSGLASYGESDHYKAMGKEIKTDLVKVQLSTGDSVDVTRECIDKVSEKSSNLLNVESDVFHQEKLTVESNVLTCDKFDMKPNLLSSFVTSECEEKLEPNMTDYADTKATTLNTTDVLQFSLSSAHDNSNNNLSNDEKSPKINLGLIEDLGCGDLTIESEASQTKPRYKKRKRRSLDIALALENKELLADMPNTDTENSEIGEQGRRSRRIRRKSLELCKGALRHSVKERHNSLPILSSTVSEEINEPLSPANEVTQENEDNTSNTVLSEIDLCVNVGPKLKTYGKRKRVESREDIENLYLNKNYQAPAEKKWETIFESPNANKSNLLGKRRMKRAMEFDINLVYHVPPVKQKKRIQRAMKYGWNPKKKKLQTLADDFVVEKISEMEKILAE